MKILVSLVSVLLLMAVTTTKNSTVSSNYLQSKTENGPLCNFFPANKLRFPIKNDGRQISRPQFRKILDAAESVYKPIFQSLGVGRFYIADRWNDDTVNACASIGAPCSKGSAAAGNTDRYVEIYGGLGRHPLMTAEGLMLVICHEIGHHIGGYPRYEKNTSVMATEGQSDYFASAKCMRLIYSALTPKTNENWAWANKNRIPQEVQKPCLNSFGNNVSAIYCMRSSLAGLSLAQVLGSLNGTDPRQLSFILKDNSVVQTTFESHPKAQCRLDTYAAGAACTADPRIPFSATNPNQGACVNKMAPGARPSCWYKDSSGLAAR